MFESSFQSFEEETDRAASAERLAALRQELVRQELDGFVVPRADRHQCEYVPACEARLAWLTGFSGSAGTAIVLKEQAAIFVDGRYALAVRDQVDTAVVTPIEVAKEKPEDWIGRHLGKGRLGFDPWLTTPAQARLLERAAKTAGGTLVALGSNPIDAIWVDRPAPPQGAITLRPSKLAGESASRKLARVAAALSGHDAQVDALVVSDPHAVAWLFNIRGSDVGHTPLPLAFALVPKQGHATLFVDAGKVGPREHKALSKLATIAEPGTLETVLDALGKTGQRVLFDAATVPARLTRGLEAAGGKAEVGTDPIALMKARKNAAELAGTREAHLRDGAAMTSFLHWLAETAKPGKITEIEAARALEAFRHCGGGLKDISFPSISAAGAHAAMAHYRVTTASDAVLERGIYLIDSGAQYEDGTTDITRTIAIGRPTAEMRDRFTRVLKGHIAIATSVFPKGTSGMQIDALARLPLWRAGLDFDHGTGHGVGAYLGVHEGPQRIAKTGTVALDPGMILSNEPGFYKAGEFGIRIENLVVVEAREVAGGDREMLGFETITFAPIDRALIDVRLLDPAERAWLDAYHAQVRRLIGPHVPPAVRRWLAESTRKL